MYMYFPSFPLKTSFLVYTKTSFLPVETLEFSERKTPLVYTFFPPILPLWTLSGMFRRSASLAIPHHKSFAAIPSLFLVLLGHTNRSVKWAHESQREIALV